MDTIKHVTSTPSSTSAKRPKSSKITTSTKPTEKSSIANSSGIKVNILSRSANNYGIGKDAKLVEQILREINSHTIGKKIKIKTIEHIDSLGFVGGRKPSFVDINIHLEVPCRSAMIWGHTNILVVNPECFEKHNYNWTLDDPNKGGMDLFVFKCKYARSLFPELSDDRTKVLNWRVPNESRTLKSLREEKKSKFLFLIGGSVNKFEAAKIIIPNWDISYPMLEVWGSTEIINQLTPLQKTTNIVWKDGYSTEEERLKSQEECKYHIVASIAEGFGYTFAECVALGALPLWTDIPVYSETYGELLNNVGKIKTEHMVENDKRDGTRSFTPESLHNAVTSLLLLSGMEQTSLAGNLRHLSTTHINNWRNSWKVILTQAISKSKFTNELFEFPPPLPKEIPTVGIITLTHNRKKWWQNMAENVLRQKYPHTNLVWIVVDDSESSQRVDHEFSTFQTAHPKIVSQYISFPKKQTIGHKRNVGVMQAIDKGANILMHMDDDDYYPSSSIVARLSWLNLKKSECVYCSTLPMYDAKRFISAINVPPLFLSPYERVSEASLAYTKPFWETKKFPTIDIAEGEEFLKDRISDTLEVMPDGILVAIQHGSNATSRRVPEEQEPNGCHYGFSDEYFSYISTIA